MSYSKKNESETIAQSFPLYEINPEKQIAKIAHRLRLGDFWSIEKGSTVLEIGCGQGDTTAVIATLVGSNGTVIAVDSADQKYGYPVNCGRSSQQLLKAPFGNRIQFLYNFDILENSTELPQKYFDYIVFSFSSWYLDNESVLFNMLKKLRRLGGKLAFAEWCLIPKKIEQLSHFLSVLIQNQIKLYNPNYETNICSFLSPETLRQIANNSGWHVCNEALIDSIKPNEGISEIEKVTMEGLSKIPNGDMPEWFKNILQVELNLLESIKNSFKILPLSTYTFVAN